MSSHPHVIFRADAGPQIGAGHVMRCLALADAMKRRGWRVTFIVNDDAMATIGTALTAAGRVIPLPTPDAASAISVVDAVGEDFDAAVVDHYGLDARFENGLRDATRCVMAIDDLADREHDCDVILDPSPGRKQTDYDGLVPAHSRRAIGPAFALLRPEFAASRPEALARRNRAISVKRILVSFGMTDPRNLTAMAIDAIYASGIDTSVDVVLGETASHLDEVRERITNTRSDVALHINPSDMAALISRADIAIGAAGGSMMERACLGLPSLVLLAADNQSENLEAITRLGMGIKVAQPSELADALGRLAADKSELRCIAENAAGSCDGLGAGRAAAALATVAASDTAAITSRPVTAEDSSLLLHWQSAPGIREFSRNPHPPSPGEHAAWMARRLRPQPGLFEIIESYGAPVGVVRLDPVTNRRNVYEVSILIAPGRHGKGIGKETLQHIRRLFPWATFEAAIHPDNAASIRIFEATHYEKEGDGYVSRPRA